MLGFENNEKKITESERGQSEEFSVQDSSKIENSINHLPQFENFYDPSDELIECGILYGDREESNKKFLNYFRPDKNIYFQEISHYSCLYLVVDLKDRAFKLGHTTNVISGGKKNWNGSGSIYYRFKDFKIIKDDSSRKLLDRIRVAVWAVTNNVQFEVGQRVGKKFIVSEIIEGAFRGMLDRHHLAKNGYGVLDGLEWKILKENDNVPLGLGVIGDVGQTEWRHLRGKDDSKPALDIFEKEVIKLLRALNRYIDEEYSMGKPSESDPSVRYYCLGDIVKV